jgi:lipoprotein-anchoring transpeptidase ErfK/SrfK
MSALRLLALSYLASAAVFVMTAAVVAHSDWARLQPPLLHEPVVRLTLTPPGSHDIPPQPKAKLPTRHKPAAGTQAANPAPVMPSRVLPDLSPESAPVPAEPKLVKPNPIAPADVRSDLSHAPAPVMPVPAHDRLKAAAFRLTDKLTLEMVEHFDLILYVSKANSGPLAQRMVVFANRDGVLTPIHDWKISTGREQDEVSPRGRSTFTATPKGFYEFDPDRMYRAYHSWNWDRDMPHAMFFNWERRGVETGLAIHAATGDDIAKLGNRASAGCVHLGPENAALLYRLVQGHEGRVPRFAYNADTETMSNSGNFMHDRKGRLKMAEGYRVLVMIDDYSGDDRLAGLD